MAEAKSRRGKRTGCMALFFLPFAAAGCAMVWFVGLQPYLMTQAARDWPAVPCVITHSEVTASTSDGSTSYRVEIHFSYELAGRRYASETYGFSDIGTGGRSAKDAIVARYPAGSDATCYVDPEDPSRAVIDREPDGNMWWGLFGLPFLLIGFGGIWFSLRQPRLRTRAFSKQRPRGFDRSDDGSDTGASSGSLKPGSSPGGKFVMMLIFALIWNGIVGTIAYVFFFKNGMSGGVEWIPTIFIGIFALIGAGLLLVGVPYQFLAMFNPMPQLRISGGEVRIGGRCRLEWELSGRHDRLQAFRIDLVGRELARYRRGTNTYTDKHVFHQARLFESLDSSDALAGSCDLVLPEDLVGSFDGGNNKIEWELQVRGDIAAWPDLSVDFPLQVGPTELAR